MAEEEKPLKVYFSMGMDSCGNHRSYNGKSTFHNGEYLDSKSIMYGGLAMTEIRTEDGLNSKCVYKVPNCASFDAERPLFVYNGDEKYEHMKEIMDIIDPEATEAQKKEYSIDLDEDTQLKLKVKLDLVQLDGKLEKIIQGRGGAHCLLCSIPKECMTNLKLVDEGFPMDMGIKDLWEHFLLIADELKTSEEGKAEYFVDAKIIPTQVRGGITKAPLVENLEVGHFIPPLHCMLRFMAFFLEMAVRFKAGNMRHGKVEEKVHEDMKKAKKILREQARAALKRGYLTPTQYGGTTDDGNAARLFFSAKARPHVLKFFETHEDFNVPEIDDSEVASDSEDEPTSGISSAQREILPTLLQNVSVILRIIRSDKEVNTEEFEKLCKDTNKILINHFSDFNITPTVHAVLAHAPDLVRRNWNRGLFNFSEEGSEASHKVVRWLREHGARKMTLEANFFDTFRKMFFISDPTIRSMRRKLKCTNCEGTGHTIRSCPDKIIDKEKSPDDILFESLTHDGNRNFEKEEDDPDDDLLDTIMEGDETEEMEHETTITEHGDESQDMEEGGSEAESSSNEIFFKSN